MKALVGQQCIQRHGLRWSVGHRYQAELDDTVPHSVQLVTSFGHGRQPIAAGCSLVATFAGDYIIVVAVQHCMARARLCPRHEPHGILVGSGPARIEALLDVAGPGPAGEQLAAYPSLAVSGTATG